MTKQRPRTSARARVRVVATLLTLVALAGCSDGPGGATCPPGLVSSGADVCIDSADRRAARIAASLRDGKAQQDLRAIIFGVWVGDHALATGAIGESEPGVPASRDQHFRIGDVTEAMTTTLLLKLVDRQRISLRDPLSTWFPALPNASRVTLQMLASSTTGYVDFVTTPAFVDAMNADPYRQWQPSELIAYSAPQTPLFQPGTSWAFSDSNFVILGEVLKQVGGAPLADLLRTEVFDPLGLADTAMSTTPDIPPPVLHGFTPYQGQYVDVTAWNPSWISNAGNSTSNLADLHAWVKAVTSGTLLSRASHELQIGPENAGLGPLTPDKYYGIGIGVASSWIFSNPHVPGYSGFVTSFPDEDIVVVVFATPGPGNADDLNDAQNLFVELAKILTPDHVPDIGQRHG